MEVDSSRGFRLPCRSPRRCTCRPILPCLLSLIERRPAPAFARVRKSRRRGLAGFVVGADRDDTCAASERERKQESQKDIGKDSHVASLYLRAIGRDASQIRVLWNGSSRPTRSRKVNLRVGLRSPCWFHAMCPLPLWRRRRSCARVRAEGSAWTHLSRPSVRGAERSATRARPVATVSARGRGPMNMLRLGGGDCLPAVRQARLLV